MVLGGVKLILLGGSLYYFLAGALLIWGAYALWRDLRYAVHLFHVFMGATLIWALWETGGEFWSMAARLFVPGLFWLAALALTSFRLPSLRMALTRVIPVIALVALVPLLGKESAGTAPSMGTAPAPDAGEWRHHGRTEGASRFSPLKQITPANVADLKLAWSYRTGDLPGSADAGMLFTFEATPLKIGDTLYLCTAHNIVVALDAETGKERWRHDPKVEHAASFLKSCRGVSYHKADRPVADCPERIIAGTLDARLIALDAKTGQLCKTFGRNGTVFLQEALGDPPPGFYYVTSPPTIVNGVAVVGGFVLDGQYVGEPSGVVRAFDVLTGSLAWAWDMGSAESKAGYTKGTPNVWAPMSADPGLGLVYLPTGNSTPDYWAAHRSAASERYGSSIVALDAATGQLRWSFQTVHHDVWDYDIPANPMLFDLKRGGETIPALVQITKMGQIFVLDRRNGRPLIPVKETPVPQDVAPGDWLSPTQPISTVPGLTPERLTEASMWGVGVLDQLWCRIAFREDRYEGLYTPPGVRPTILYPGPYGAMNWGAGTIDEDNGLLIANSNRLPFVSRLIPREEVNAMLARAKKETGRAVLDPHLGISVQVGTPFAFRFVPMLSPLGIPCNEPPWGQLSAINYNGNRMAWQIPLGTTQDKGPLGLPFNLPLPTGVFSVGGPTATRGGLTFIAAAIDDYLRAYDSRTGKLLWRARLPAGGQASPMTYWSEKSGRQFVLIAAGGHGALQTKLGDYVLAYALPATGKQP